MRSFRFLTLSTAAALVAASLAACGDDAPAAPSASDLEGRAFVATEIEDHTIVDGSEVVVSFEDGGVVVEAGCNTQRGEYEIDDAGVLAVGQLLSTMMACDDALMAQDALLAEILSAGPTVELDGEELVLRTDATTVTMTERI
jgi:heat shock protein HslJ